jgi:hypothetical protein
LNGCRQVSLEIFRETCSDAAIEQRQIHFVVELDDRLSKFVDPTMAYRPSTITIFAWLYLPGTIRRTRTPRTPGLGLEINEAALAQRRVELPGA